jgi:hypothetical protein
VWFAIRAVRTRQAMMFVRLGPHGLVRVLLYRKCSHLSIVISSGRRSVVKTSYDMSFKQARPPIAIKGSASYVFLRLSLPPASNVWRTVAMLVIYPRNARNLGTPRTRKLSRQFDRQLALTDIVVASRVVCPKNYARRLSVRQME